MKHPFLAGAVSPRVVAHRGFVSAEAADRGVLENTEAAFDAATQLGVVTLESDCRATRDGHVVLVHDADLVRVVGRAERIDELTKAQLEARLSDRGGLLTLADALERFPRAHWNIDVKTEDAVHGAGLVAAAHPERMLLTSFTERYRRASLRVAHEHNPVDHPATAPGQQRMIRVLLAVASGSRTLAARALQGLDALQIPERQGPIRVLTSRLVRMAHENGVEVHVWTVNDEAQMRRLEQFGVDRVVTDRSDLAIRVFAEPR